MASIIVATVLTVYGIETSNLFEGTATRDVKALQQYLPFTVLKPIRYYLSPTTGIQTGCNSTYRLRY